MRAYEEAVMDAAVWLGRAVAARERGDARKEAHYMEHHETCNDRVALLRGKLVSGTALVAVGMEIGKGTLCGGCAARLKP